MHGGKYSFHIVLRKCLGQSTQVQIGQTLDDTEKLKWVNFDVIIFERKDEGIAFSRVLFSDISSVRAGRYTDIKSESWDLYRHVSRKSTRETARRSSSGAEPHSRSFLFYPLFNKNQADWSFLSPELQVTWRAVAIIIRVVLLSSHLCIRGISLSSIHYNQSHRIY